MNITMMSCRRSANAVHTLTVTAMLAAVSYILAFAAFPVPLSPSFAKMDVVLYNAFPFNLLKGAVISLCTMAVYKRLSPILKGTKKYGSNSVSAKALP